MEPSSLFLERIIPTAARCGIKWRSIPMIRRGRFRTPAHHDFRRKHRAAATACRSSGEWRDTVQRFIGRQPRNDISAMIHAYADRIPFAHIRNVKVYENGDFIETSHRTKMAQLTFAGLSKPIMKQVFRLCASGSRPPHLG
ncbi:mannonate dehydratase [Bacillus licheniformis]|nr:mannonate dehydratase [Bacillus licheniformis]